MVTPTTVAITDIREVLRATWLLPHGLLASFSLIWLCIVIVVIHVAAFGPKASRLRVETIAS